MKYVKSNISKFTGRKKYDKDLLFLCVQHLFIIFRNWGKKYFKESEMTDNFGWGKAVPTFLIIEYNSSDTPTLFISLSYFHFPLPFLVPKSL